MTKLETTEQASTTDALVKYLDSTFQPTQPRVVCELLVSKSDPDFRREADRGSLVMEEPSTEVQTKSRKSSISVAEIDGSIQIMTATMTSTKIVDSSRSPIRKTRSQLIEDFSRKLEEGETEQESCQRADLQMCDYLQEELFASSSSLSVIKCQEIVVPVLVDPEESSVTRTAEAKIFEVSSMDGWVRKRKRIKLAPGPESWLVWELSSSEDLPLAYIFGMDTDRRRYYVHAEDNGKIKLKRASSLKDPESVDLDDHEDDPRVFFHHVTLMRGGRGGFLIPARYWNKTDPEFSISNENGQLRVTSHSGSFSDLWEIEFD